MGPLRVLKSNPRYFTDGSGRAILLAGSHIWRNFQDMGHRMPESKDPPAAFDYDGYLEFLASHHHNFIRLWRWEVPRWTDVEPKGTVQYAVPQPWRRTGPGFAADGKPKFDLTQFDPTYFDRLRNRVKTARDRDIYVSVMLFEGWELQFTDAAKYHPFYGDNNVNGIHVEGTNSHTLADTPMGKRVWKLQEDYVRRVVDTVNDLDNVLYEIANESGAYSTEWQYQLIRFVHQYEAGKPQQHPVGMSFQYKDGSNKALFDSPADWIAPNPGNADERYRDDPSPAYRGKVILNDTDHLWGLGGDNTWVWKSFTRGLNVLFMDDMLPSPVWLDSGRIALGQVIDYSRKVDLARMEPAGHLSQTRYCLAKPGKEYLVFQPGDQGRFTVNLSGASGMFNVEWLEVNSGHVSQSKAIRGGGSQLFTTPFPGPAVLYINTASRSDKN